MHLIYVDDSGEDAGHQAIAAIVVPEHQFLIIESYLSGIVEGMVPEELRPSFEFHASKMFHLVGEFAKLGSRDNILKIFDKCVSIVAGAPIPVVYGAVNLRRLRRSLYSTARPTDVAFRLCLDELAVWFAKVPQPDIMKAEIGILICDDTDKQHIKKDMQQSYRAYRKRLKAHPVSGDMLSEPPRLFDFLHDDMYFGDSSYSVGIQLADICAFIILRHLQGHQDTEYLYKQLEPQIYSAEVEPKQDE